MISWRYHLISIVAVFLALALGVLAGSTVIKQNLISSLQTQTSELASQRDQQENRANQAVADLGAANQTIAVLAQAYLVGRLEGERVLIVTPNNVDSATLSQAERSISDAGAKVLATLTVNLHGLDTAALAAAINLPSTSSPTQLANHAAHVLATRLWDGSIANQQKDDVLYQVLKSGLLYVADNSSIPTTMAIGGPDLRVIVVGPTDPTKSVPLPADFIDPFVSDLARLGIRVAVAAPTASAPDFLTPIQQDPNAAQLLTVNDADTQVGGIALVLGLERLVKFDRGGIYGTGSGGSIVLATPSPATP